MARANSRALLIGCDFYFAGSTENAGSNSIRFPHLHGAVQDVNDVEGFLVSIGVPKDNIVKLTASYDPNFPLCPTEDDKSKWPTHANIIRELEKITERSAHGALVYIHFSGHGIQRGKVSKQKKSSGGDSLFGAALATTDVLKDGGRYLTGHELGLRIRAMAKTKELRVTVVLDACFSGRGLRQGATYTVRTIPDYQDDRDLDNDRVAEKEAFEYLARISSTRQADINEDWLSNPVGCTVLTACGIQQTAGEDTFQDIGKDTRSRRGVLTHWMLEFLNQRRTPNSFNQRRSPKFPSYTAVKEYVINKIKTTTPDINQTPVLYGDAKYEFFGDQEDERGPTCRVIEVWDDKVRLDVGSVQGVAVGAVYDIYPAEVDSDDIRNFDLAQEARIVKVDSFHSVAMLTDIDAAQGLEPPSVTEGSSGVLRNWALRDRVLVKFMQDDAHMRELLKNEIEKTPNLALHDGQSDGETFTVRVDQEGNFEILERGPGDNEGIRLQRIPIIAVNAELAITKLAYVLRHVSRYRDIERLRNLPRSTRLQEEKLDIFFFRDTKRLNAVEVNGLKTFEVVEGEILDLRLKYNGPSSFVHATLFELSPSWGIRRQRAFKLVRDRLEPDEYEMPLSFRTEIPKPIAKSDSKDTCDVFMVFLVEGEDEQSWDEITLAALPTDARDLAMNTGVDARPTKRAEIQVPKTPPYRHWGVVSFVVHSSPTGNNMTN